MRGKPFLYFSSRYYGYYLTSTIFVAIDSNLTLIKLAIKISTGTLARPPTTILVPE